MNATDLLLIALLPEPQALLLAQAGHYRLPLAHAPACLAQARALAFYQPASFGAARWQVAWWGEIQALHSALRRELLPEPDHPRADCPYLSVELAPLVPLDPPKQASKGRRLLFVPTTWGAFQAAPTLDTLFRPAPRPIADDPLYQLIQQQVAGQSTIPDPHAPRQLRLFERGAPVRSA